MLSNDGGTLAARGRQKGVVPRCKAHFFARLTLKSDCGSQVNGIKGLQPMTVCKPARFTRHCLVKPDHVCRAPVGLEFPAGCGQPGSAEPARSRPSRQYGASLRVRNE